MQKPDTRNITRYTYSRTAFQGWRVCISRSRRQFTRYFSDKAFGGEENSFAAALELRNHLLAALQAEPNNVDAVFAKFAAIPASR